MIASEPARWDAQAERYDSSYDDPGRRGRLVRARLQAAMELLGDEPGRVLDAGMGGGRLVEKLAGRGWAVTGTDVSAAMVELARRRVPQLADSLVVAPIEQLPFESESFDAVTALGVLEYAEDAWIALAELSRVLSKGGLAVVSWPNFGGLYTGWRGNVLYPLLRAAKRIAPIGSPPPLPAPKRPVVERFTEVMRDAGLDPFHEVVLGVGGKPTARCLGPLLGAQVVFAARKES